MASETRAALPIVGFLALLRRQGFVIGVETHLRAQQLLQRAAGECTPGDLKTLLCPLFAASAEQQERFYRAFDTWFDLFVKDLDRVPGEDKDEPAALASTPRSAFRRRVFIGASAAVLMLAAAAVFLPRSTPQAPPANQVAPPLPPAIPQAAPQKQNPVPTPPAAGGQPEAAAPIPAGPAPVPPAIPPIVGDRKILLRWGAMLAPLVFWLSYELYRLSRRKLALQKQKGGRAPYSWPIRAQSRVRIYESAQFYSAARRLHRRQRGESVSLDVEASIAATIGSVGFPVLQYRPDSRLPEYLVLIDRASFRDHQTHLFENLAAGLHDEGLFVTTMFFDNDPRVCSAPDGASWYLVDVERRFSGHRLILFSDGEQLVDPVSGRLAGWSSLFLAWKERAVLTPRAASAWGLSEKSLATRFIVLPASLDGLLALVSHFEQSMETDLRSWRENSGEPMAPDCVGPAVVQQLRDYLGAPAFEWLCACAMYPELHWDLTLRIGSAMGMAGNPVNETNLLRLIRLPWFRSGSIPDEIRALLVRELPSDRRRGVREAIIDLLEQNPPPEASAAGDARGFEIALHRHLLTGRQRRALRKAMKTVPPAELVQDRTTLESLESAKVSPLDFVLPVQLRRALFARGLPAFGLKGGIQLAAAAACLIIATAVTVSMVRNRAMVETARVAAAGPFDDLRRLETLRQTLVKLEGFRRNGPPWSYRWGLYAEGELYPQVRQAYFDGFRQELLAPAQDAIVAFLRELPEASSGPEYVRAEEALKAYLVTTSQYAENDEGFLSPVLTKWWGSSRRVEQDVLQLARKQFDFYAGEIKQENPFFGAVDNSTIAIVLSYLGASPLAPAPPPAPIDPLVAPPVFAAAPQDGKRLAVIIGNGSYVAYPLRNAVNDAQLMNKVLRAAGFQTVMRTNATKAAMEEALVEVVEKLKPDDTALFFYSGHGLKIDNESFLAPVDFERGSSLIRAKTLSFSLRLALDFIQRARPRRTILVLDAGPLAETQNAGPEKFVAFSSSPNEAAYEDPSAANGLFIETLADLISQPGLTIEETFMRAGKRVQDATNGRQNPWTQSSLTGKFIFRAPALPSMEQVYQNMLVATDKGNPTIQFNGKFPGSAETVVNAYQVRGAFSKGGWEFMKEAIRHPERYGGEETADMGRLAQFRNRYVADFIFQWRSYLRAASVVRYASIADAAKKLGQLSSDQSPLLALFWLVSQNTAVDEPKIAGAFQAVQTVVPPASVNRYIALHNQPYVGALAAMKASLEQLTSPPNSAAIAQLLGIAVSAKVTSRSLGQAFRPDAEGRVDAVAQKLLDDPITYLEALLRNDNSTRSDRF